LNRTIGFGLVAAVPYILQLQIFQSRSEEERWFFWQELGSVLHALQRKLARCFRKEKSVKSENKQLRILYSFPHKLGADRICHTAWEQVNGLAAAGAQVLAFPGVLHRPVRANVAIRPTLAWGKLRISYKLFTTIRACALHDYVVACRLEKLAKQVDIVHAWPLGATKTLKTAARLGIPTVLERPNAHTRFAYEVVQKECERLGVSLPSDHEHSYNERVLRHEEEEYRLAYRLLCPSDFVAKTFAEKGFPPERLMRHQYGFDENVFYPPSTTRSAKQGLTMIYVGVCAVRKGLHFALEAWLRSPAHRNGTFLIVGAFIPDYERKLAQMLAHPSVRVLGHRNDVPELMRQSDVFVLPTLEEGYPLACVEALGSGCVPLVSETCLGICEHMQNAMVHKVGDVESLAQHITMLCDDRVLLERLRRAVLSKAPAVTWTAAGERLLQVYREVITQYSSEAPSDSAGERPASNALDRLSEAAV
jgi:glycosyltransferase involved in cell wall biosynthesis